MKISLQARNGKSFEIEIKARDERNLNASKKATKEVLDDLEFLFSCAEIFATQNNQRTLSRWAIDNSIKIQDIIL